MTRWVPGCPTCGASNMASWVTDLSPSPVCYCLSCRRMLVFDGFTLRFPTDEEEQALLNDGRTVQTLEHIGKGLDEHG